MDHLQYVKTDTASDHKLEVGVVCEWGHTINMLFHINSGKVYTDSDYIVKVAVRTQKCNTVEPLLKDTSEMRTNS